jgi:hypothetical protein
MAPSAFKQIVFEIARQAGGRVADIVEPDITPNFIAARIELGPTRCYLLHADADHWAFTEAIEPALTPLTFTDCPALAEAMTRLFGITPLTRAELNAPFTKLPGLSDSDIRYWKPRTLGDALFNWWD